MEQKTKRILLFLGALFTLVIFVSSSGGLGNNSVASSSTTSARQVQAFPVFGNSTATITGYGLVAHLGLATNSSAVENNVQKALSKLQASGSINSYLGANTSYDVYLATINAYSLQGVLQKAVNATGVVALTALTYVRLPVNVTLFYNKVPVNIYLNNRNYSFNVTGLSAPGARLNVSLAALVTNNRTLYNNQLTVSLRR